MNIVPAIDEQTGQDFEASVNKVKDFAQVVHVDFNDGSFGDYKTVGPQDIEKYILAQKARINFEAHLMVQQPYDYIPKLIESGFRKIIIQFEIDLNLRDLLEELLIDNVLAGVAIGPETAIADAEPIFDLVDTITIMTVYPGRQGQAFLPEPLEKVKRLRADNFQQEVEVDGGITSDNIRLVADLGVDTAIVGHYIMNDEDPGGKYEALVRFGN